jgi:hypothetical protein
VENAECFVVVLVLVVVVKAGGSDMVTAEFSDFKQI